MAVKESLEIAIRTGGRPKKTSLPKSTSSQIRLSGASTPQNRSTDSPGSSIHESMNNAGSSVGISSNSPRANGPVSSRSFNTPPSRKGHDRSGSLLSFNTRNMVNHFNDSPDSAERRRPSVDEDEFDALVRSGETMKVSLTPSRLKNFDVSLRAADSS